MPVAAVVPELLCAAAVLLPLEVRHAGALERVHRFLPHLTRLANVRRPCLCPMFVRDYDRAYIHCARFTVRHVLTARQVCPRASAGCGVAAAVALVDSGGHVGRFDASLLLRRSCASRILIIGAQAPSPPRARALVM